MNSINRLYPCLYRCRCRWLASLAGGAFAVLAALNSTAALSQPSNTPVDAQWQSFDLPFHYFGFTTYYSCSGLEDRLEQILSEMGADQDVRVTASGCFGLNDVNNMLSVRIRVRMPAAGSVEKQSFQAVSKPVTLQTRRLGERGAGDCELLENVRDQLLPAFKLQLVKDGLHCVPGQTTVGTQTLQVLALIAQPAQP